MSIRKKILLLVIVSIMVIVSCIAITIHIQSKQSLINTFSINAQAQAERMKDFTNKFLDDGRAIINFIAKHPDIVNAQGKLGNYIHTTKETRTDSTKFNDYEKKLSDVFRYYLETNPSYALIYMGTDDGSFTQLPNDELPAGFDPRQREWYQKALIDPNKVFLSDGYVSTNGTIVYSLSKAVFNPQNRVIGVVAIDIYIVALNSFFEKIKIGKTGHAIVIENNSTIISDSDRPVNMGKKIKELNEPSLESVFRAKEGFSIISIAGEKHLAFVTTTKDSWRFILLMDEQEAVGNAFENLKITLAIGAGSAILMIILSLFIVRSIVAPIDRLVLVAKNVAQGDLKAISTHDKYTGELKSLYESIVHMVDNLAKFISTANEKTEEAKVALENGQHALKDAELARNQAVLAKSEGMRSAAASLTGIVTNIDQAARALSSEIDYSNNGTIEQAARVAQTSLSMEEMNRTVMEVAHNASKAAFVTTKAKEKATEGVKSMQEVVVEIYEVEASAHAMQEDMVVLETHAQSISKIMNVISDIADQTNLLALNAAIEAARAGDAGRGFAVVADEVRKLAEKTMVSTTDVGNAIKAIQSSVSKSKAQMDKAAIGITQTTNKAKLSGDTLNEIQRMVDQAQAEVQAIATASEQQSATSEEITRDIAMVNDIAKNTATAMENSSQIINKLSNQAKELDKLIVEMKNS